MGWILVAFLVIVLLGIIVEIVAIAASLWYITIPVIILILIFTPVGAAVWGFGAAIWAFIVGVPAVLWFMFAGVFICIGAIGYATNPD